MTLKAIETELEKSEETLLRELGYALLEGRFAAGEPSDEEAVEEARLHLRREKESLQKILCGTLLMQSLQKNPSHWDQINLSAAIIDILLAVGYKLPGGGSQIVALLVKIGIGKLCMGHDLDIP
jgi:hypothetical protein